MTEAFVIEGVDLRQLINREYGLEAAEFVRLNGFADLSHRFVDKKSGRVYTFKIFKDACNDNREQNEAEIELIKHLKNNDIPVPEIIPTLSRNFIGQAVFEGGVEQRFRMQTYLEGEVVDQAYNEKLCQSLGNLTGRLVNVLSSFKNQFYEANVEIHYIMEHKVYPVRELVKTLTDEHQLQLVNLCFEQYEEKIVNRLEKLEKQVVHSDMHGRNLIMNCEQGTEITGLIDFSDARLTLRIMEPAVALVGVLVGKDMNETNCVLSFLETFSEIVQLNREEREALPVLIAARFVMLRAILRSANMDGQDCYYGRVYADAWRVVEDLLVRRDSNLFQIFDRFANKL